MNPASTSFVLGYHGCDAAVADAIFAGRAALAASGNDYDRLGHGTYFWEHNAERAHAFAREVRDRPRRGEPTVRRPAVVGAVIDLGLCLNLLDGHFLGAVRQAYDSLAGLHEGGWRAAARQRRRA